MALMNIPAAADARTSELPEVADPSRVAPLEEGTPEYSYARSTLIEMNMSLVRYAAGRGLIKAIDRCELTPKGSSLS